jgi:hypothetical protein
MDRPTIYQMEYRNPHAVNPLIIPVLVLCNTSDEKLLANIKANAALDREWIAFEPANKRQAIMCGGGPSLVDQLDEIRKLRDQGGVVFAMNGASKFLNDNGIRPTFQVIADAKPETATLVDPSATCHLFASQVDPACFEAVPKAVLWHLECTGMEDVFPAERKAKGGYALIGGGASVGNSAMCLAYVMGYRTFHVFGYDSSHRGDASHAYEQPMNRFIPTLPVEWAGRKFISSVAMKAQAEKFQMTGQALKQEGCTINVYGDGLLPAMWNTPVSDISEKNKYQLVWQFDSYRDYSPGEQAVDTFLEQVKPTGLIIDFGCGTGRASLALAKAGHAVLLIDFADNCRDGEASSLPFLEWDLALPCPARADFGICCDVMEHIPPESVETVVRNIMEAAAKVFFQISTVKDRFGALIGADLHLSVQPHEWWRELFQRLGYGIAWDEDQSNQSRFVVTR